MRILAVDADKLASYLICVQNGTDTDEYMCPEDLFSNIKSVVDIECLPKSHVMLYTG